jgi:hypothetical protein
MRALFTGLLAATLVGCTSVRSPETHVAQKPVAFEPSAGAAKPAASKPSTRTAKPVTSKKISSKRISSKKIKAVAKLKYTGTTTPLPPALPKKADPVIEKAKTAVAAILDEPASAEFYDVKRAKKKLPHRTVDTICGYVKAPDGGETRGMPFLFTVDDGEVYLVNGRSQMSETVYTHLCR